MESYLKGRGFKNPVETENVSFKGYLDGQKESRSDEVLPNLEPVEQEKETIYEEEGCPKVEVVSTDGRPTCIVIHLPDGRLLEIDCHY